MAAKKACGLEPEVFLIGLWKHECERVFVDKLTNNPDKEKVKNYINEITIETFNQHEAEIVEKFKKEQQIYFCDFLREDIKNEDGIIEEYADKVYESIWSFEAL